MKTYWMTLISIILLLLFSGCSPMAPAEPEEVFSFSYQGAKLVPNTDVSDVISTLGEPMKYSEETSCAFEGLDKTYYYGSFYISTYPMDGKDYIYCIWFADDTVTTEEGIRIGSTQKEAEAVYGADSFDGEHSFVLTKGNTQLTVILSDGFVSAIRYDAFI